jgi:hypothetical protein
MKYRVSATRRMVSIETKKFRQSLDVVLRETLDCPALIETG